MKVRMEFRHSPSFTWTAALCSVPLLMGVAQANSGYGVDTAPGNAMNPAGFPATRPKDADGLGIQEYSRSPSGLMVARPYQLIEPTLLSKDWQVAGWAEFGGLMVNGDPGAAKFREYKDVKEGPYLNYLGVQLEKTATALFIDISGGNSGYNDQFASISIGKYNRWKVQTFYRETPHVFTSSYRSLWNRVVPPMPPPLTSTSAMRRWRHRIQRWNCCARKAACG
jgi:hypothetical protein